MKDSFLWITDPWDTLDHPKDTTLRLIEESLILGKRSYWCDVRTIRLENNEVLLDFQAVETVYPGRTSQAFRLGRVQSGWPSEFRSLQYRVDPPVDLAYIHPLQLLKLGTEKKSGVEIVNPVDVLLGSNEKTEASVLGNLMPPTVVASQWNVLEAFGRSEGRTILKPLHQAQSKGVSLLDWKTPQGTRDAREKILEATAGYSLPVTLQRYLPGIAEGEQRLWFLDGKLLGVARKRPKSGEFLINMDQGSTVTATELTASEKKAALRIGKRLSSQGIRLAAVDLIEGYVTDFNITSPGLLTQTEAVMNRNLAKPVIQALSRRRKS